MQPFSCASKQAMYRLHWNQCCESIFILIILYIKKEFSAFNALINNLRVIVLGIKSVLFDKF